MTSLRDQSEVVFFTATPSFMMSGICAPCPVRRPRSFSGLPSTATTSAKAPGVKLASRSSVVTCPRENGRPEPKGVCSNRAQMPRRIWVAIGNQDWSPTPSYPPVRTVRFSDKYLQQGIEHHQIAGVSVPIYSVPKTLADIFRNPKLVDRSVAIEGLRAAIEQRKARPGEIAQAAVEGGAWKKMQPYLEALTSNG